jgi:hypothetical protein
LSQIGSPCSISLPDRVSGSPRARNVGPSASSSSVRHVPRFRAGLPPSGRSSTLLPFTRPGSPLRTADPPGAQPGCAESSFWRP